MAHNITQRDGLWSVRDPGWHGLATVFDDYPTIEEARKIALGWDPVAEPLYRRVVTVGDDGNIVESFEEVPGSQAMTRDDTNELLGVTSKDYGVVTNTDLFEIAQSLEESAGDVRLETGGSLLGGRKVWLLVRLQEPLVLNGRNGRIDDSATIPYFALQNAHDGSGSCRGQAVMTRIICDNTAQASDLEAKRRNTEFVFRHVGNVRDRIEEAKAALQMWRSDIESWTLLQQDLLGLDVTKEDHFAFAECFIPMPKEGTFTGRVRDNVLEARQALVNILRGPTCSDINLSAYGLVQGAVEYLNHARRARNQQTRFRRNYLERSTYVTNAVEIARELASL